MSAANMIVVVLAIVAVAAVVAWFFLRRADPENASGHAGPPRTSSTEFFGNTHDRPAGPGAEADGVADRGEPAPGPSAESLD